MTTNHEPSLPDARTGAAARAVVDAAPHATLREIQALRGVAVLMTFAAHAPGVYPQLQKLLYLHFWTGVDLFLTISGYVIAKSFFPSIFATTDRPAQFKLAVAFWIRRAYRLLPASVFWALFLLLASLVFNRTGIFAPPGLVFKEMMAALFYAKNIAEAYNFKFSLGPYWSLSLEEQFYFVLPFIIIFLPLLLRPLVYMPLVLLLSAWPGLLGDAHPFFRFESFLVGIFIYQMQGTVYRQIFEPLFLRHAGKRVLAFGIVLGLMVLAPSVFDYTKGSSFYVLVCAGLLVFFATYDQGYLPMGGPLGRLARWLGDRSYSIYLCHMPALLLTYELASRVLGLELRPEGLGTTVLAVMFALALTILLSCASHAWLEKPWQALGKQTSQAYLARFNSPPFP